MFELAGYGKVSEREREREPATAEEDTNAGQECGMGEAEVVDFTNGGDEVEYGDVFPVVRSAKVLSLVSLE
jgi:hypothetical protein